MDLRASADNRSRNGVLCRFAAAIRKSDHLPRAITVTHYNVRWLFPVVIAGPLLREREEHGSRAA